MTNDTHPDAILSSLLSLGPRSHKAAILQKLHEICRLQYAIPNPALRDFSIANIGKLCEAQDLFKGRILYNESSKDYVSLIKAWEVFSGSYRVSVRKNKDFEPSPENAFLLKIDDFAIRQRMQAIIAERDNLRKQLSVLKSQSNFVIDQRPLGATIAKGCRNAVVIEPKVHLTDSERNALQRAISEESLNEVGLSLGPAGAVLNEKNQRTIHDPGFVTGLRKLLGQE